MVLAHRFDEVSLALVEPGVTRRQLARRRFQGDERRVEVPVKAEATSPSL